MSFLLVTTAWLLVSAGLASAEQASANGEANVPEPALESPDGLRHVEASESSDDATVIDILFVYSKLTAERWESGLRARVEEMVDRTSIVMLNSGANARLRLVGLEPAPAYVDLIEADGRDPRSGQYRRTLARLQPPWCDDRTPDDCGVTERLRERFGADLLYALVDVYFWCGSATLPLSVEALASGSSFLGVISTNEYRSCMRGNNLAHMVGHNLGLHHNPLHGYWNNLGADPHRVGTPVFPGGYGFFKQTRSDGAGYGTIMAVGNLSRQWRFSTSRETHNGKAIGLSDQHEASDALRWAAPFVAAYKQPRVVDASLFPCTARADSDCMGKGRFRVRVSYRAPDGLWNRARVTDAYVGDDAGLFYFFSAENPELLLKVVDGCAVNGRHWVFGSAATDLNYEVEIEDAAGGAVKRYARDRTNALISDTSAFACDMEPGVLAVAQEPESGPSVPDGRSWPDELTRTRAQERSVSSYGWTSDVVGLNGNLWSSDAVGVELVPDAFGGGERNHVPVGVSLSAATIPEGSHATPFELSCGDMLSHACMHAGRFKVRIDFWNPKGEGVWGCFGNPGSRKCEALLRDATIGDNGGLFYFFSWNNPEVLVKVLDGCGVNGHYWVFGSGATGLEYEIKVSDYLAFSRNPFHPSETSRRYRRNAADPLVADITAFPCAPAAAED